MVIYKVTNLINQKIYIGQTQQKLAQRWREHCRSKCKMLLNKAIKKYGRENFTIEPIFETDDLDILNQMEARLIEAFQAQDKKIGYNIRSGGKNYIMAEETKEKLRQINLGKKHKPETIEKFKNIKHRKKTPEECEEIRQRLLGKKHSPERIANRVAATNYKPHSEEHKAKLSAATKGKPKSEEAKANMRAYHAKKKAEREQNG